MKLEISKGGDSSTHLERYLSPVGVWALSFGAAVGWGAFVMPGTVFLPVAGPLGTAIGIGIGALVMFIIGINYKILMQRYPDAGGAYSYVKRVLNYDHGYLCAWFLILTYLAIAWANATALAIIGRSVLGGVFAVGPHYTVAGYEVYLGEVGLSMFALIASGLFLIFPKRIGSRIETLMAVVLFGGIVVAFGAALWKNGGSHMVTPQFSLSGERLTQVLSIVALAPWAYVGFETVSHSMEEIKFRSKFLFPDLIIVLLTTAFAYVALVLVGASAQPEGFANWQEYVSNLGNVSGLAHMPVFYSVKAALGKTGLVILCFAALGAIFTGLIAHTFAASRLVLAMSRDALLPPWFGKINKNGSPTNAVMVLIGMSCFVPFLGRTTIGWIVDVTSIGASIAYAYVSFCAFRVACEEKKFFVAMSGMLGLLISFAYILYFMIPSFWAVGALAEESYFILAGWCILGFVTFRGIFSRDKSQKLGKSFIVWLALLFMIFFSSHMWVRQATHRMTSSVLTKIGEYYHAELDEAHVLPHAQEEDEKILSGQRLVIDNALTFDNFIQMTLVVFALAIMFSIYSTMAKREHKAAKAKEYFFSTVSHDIRTPLNAIIGYSQMLKLGFSTKEEQHEAVNSILVSSETLLRLINDILDLSALGAGKMSIDPEPTDVSKLFNDIVMSFKVSAKKHAVELRSNIEQMPLLLIDPLRLRQLAFNLVGNALKFTDKGHVEVRASFICNTDIGRGMLRFEVEDTGIGISEEDQAKISAPYVQVTAKTARHGGTGLGLAICKQLVHAMGGYISLKSKLGEGSTFTLEIPNVKVRPAEGSAAGVPHAAAWTAGVSPAKDAPANADAPATASDAVNTVPPAPPAPAVAASAADAPAIPAPTAAQVVEADSYVAQPPAAPAKAKTKLLIVDDSKMNLMVLKALLKKLGNFDIETAADGKEAFQKLDRKDHGFDGVLTDMWMPEMDGAGLASAIRENPELSSLPVYVVTADIELQKDFSQKGFDDILLKPVTLDLLKSKCSQLLDADSAADKSATPDTPKA